MSLLEVKNLKTYFHTKDGVVKAVDDVSFTLEAGEAIGLVGESGCGKTTTALSITSLLPKEGKVEGGEILFEGKNLLDLNENQIRRYRWNKISIAFQGAMNALNPVKRIGEQITEVMMYHNALDYKSARKKAKELLELVEIDSKRIDQYPHEFSGGMKQRVMIAMALACEPKILIGDEPTTALDVMVQAQILELLERLRAELKMSMILITHDLSVMAETCDKAAVMYAGKIVETGNVENIMNHSSHPYTQKLVKAFPDINGVKAMTESIPGAPPDLSAPPTGCYFHPRCEYATDICRQTIPPLKKLNEGHYAACHLRGD
ncbi:ABC transporter ATP-binding protein [Mesobacillus jeotgali]|uniref:ABC transporter ATP-binding protein n=1 Tax=Mesobacillus jeotgali TaxID=129985 RepID=UPI000C848319|nr:ABC transporter ATP-binding protein [Mesobacillus jeotgali]